MLSLHRSEPIDYSVDVDLDLNILLVFEILCGSQKWIKLELNQEQSS